jgi:hypothetical protein
VGSGCQFGGCVVSLVSWILCGRFPVGFAIVIALGFGCGWSVGSCVLCGVRVLLAVGFLDVGCSWGFPVIPRRVFRPRWCW